MKSILGAIVFTAVLAHAEPLFNPGSLYLASSAQSRAATFENPTGAKGQGGQTNHGAKGDAHETLKAHETKVLLDVPGSGLIRRIWFTLDRDGRSPRMLRSLRLKMFWDGAKEPAVDAPLGDFFCAGLGRMTAFESSLFTSPEGRSFNCYLPMPFRRGARIVIENEADNDVAELYYEIDFTLEPIPKDALYFHAHWNRQKAVEIGQDFELLPKVSGRGRFLGVNVGVNVSRAYPGTWYGEGEVKMYLDGDGNRPTMVGTGTEDYIGSGWGEARFTNAYQGCTIADKDHQSFAFYRFHVPDPVYFQKDFRATIQELGSGRRDVVQALIDKGAPLKPVAITTPHGGRVRLLDEDPAPNTKDERFATGWICFYRSDDYSATSYFYLDRPEDGLPDLAPVAERLP